MRTFLFFLTLSAAAQTLPPITQAGRMQWAALSTAGAPSLAGGAISSALGTAMNNPPEYGPHWDGWGKRQALRLSGAGASNLMEAELGALWGEDPRYHRSTANGFGGRVWHAVKSAFLAYDANGDVRPAYARYAAVPVSNVISNSWRPDSQRTAGNVAARTSLGFLSRVAANTFAEFWPDVRKMRRR